MRDFDPETTIYTIYTFLTNSNYLKKKLLLLLF